MPAPAACALYAASSGCLEDDGNDGSGGPVSRDLGSVFGSRCPHL